MEMPRTIEIKKKVKSSGETEGKGYIKVPLLLLHIFFYP